MTKSWTLTINNSPPFTLTLAPLNQWGYCFKCQTQKPIRIISHQIFETHKFCSNCALVNLEELAEYEFANKSQIVKELHHHLMVGKQKVESENHG